MATSLLIMFLSVNVLARLLNEPLDRRGVASLGGLRWRQSNIITLDVTSVEFDHMSLLIEACGNGAHIRTGRITDCTCSVRPTVVQPDGKPYYDAMFPPYVQHGLRSDSQHSFGSGSPGK
jgi:hypothetical protein